MLTVADEGVGMTGEQIKNILSDDFIISSAMSMLSVRSENAISGSIIQNSEACLCVFDLSALNVGPKVYT